MTTWYYMGMDEPVGPLSSTELRRHALDGKLTADSYVRQGIDGPWVSAKKVEGLFGGKLMTTQAKIIGVHPVLAEVPVYLIELLVEGDVENFDIHEVTQTVPGQSKMNRQAPYDARVLEKSGGMARYAFFFRYLNLKQPLLTPAGLLPLPKTTTASAHLQGIVYKPQGLSRWGCSFLAIWPFVVVALTVLYTEFADLKTPLWFVILTSAAGWPIWAGIGRLFGWRMRRG